MINVYNFMQNNIEVINVIKNDNPITIGQVLKLNTSKIEKFIVMCYQNHQCTGICLMSNGNESSTNVSYDKIINAIILLEADEFKILHNHPSGILKESINDSVVNDKCTKLAEYFNVKFSESFIISNNKWYEIFSKRRSQCREE